jgi:hypothetical protein
MGVRRCCEVLALVAVALNAVACFRYVSVDPREATKLSSEQRSPGDLVVIRTRQGELRSLDDFDSVIVRWREQCTKPEYCRKRAEKYRPPLSIALEDEEFTIIDPRHHDAYRTTAIEAVVIRQFAPERTGIVLGVAMLTAGLVGWGSTLFVPDDARESTRTGIALGLGLVAGPLTLPLTMKWTKPLGEPVSVPDTP